jgi:hypothetical protein
LHDVRVVAQKDFLSRADSAIRLLASDEESRGTSMLTHNSIVQWSPDAVATEVDDEIVLMNMQRNRCYGLGETGSEIWRRLTDPLPVSALIVQLESLFEAPSGQIESDVLRTLDEFAREGLIEVSSGGN